MSDNTDRERSLLGRLESELGDITAPSPPDLTDTPLAGESISADETVVCADGHGNLWCTVTGGTLGSPEMQWRLLTDEEVQAVQDNDDRLHTCSAEGVGEIAHAEIIEAVESSRQIRREYARYRWPLVAVIVIGWFAGVLSFVYHLPESSFITWALLVPSAASAVVGLWLTRREGEAVRQVWQGGQDRVKREIAEELRRQFRARPDPE